MPLYLNVKHRFFHLVVWKITENETELCARLKLHPSDEERYEQLHTPPRRREFLALRECLRQQIGHNPAVHYHPTGKPYLQRPENISFTHSHNYAAVIRSSQLSVGIDLEGKRPSIQRIQSRFVRPEEARSLRPDLLLEQLTTLWSAKECAVKITGNRRLDFLREIRISPFFQRSPQALTGRIILPAGAVPIQLYSKQYPDFHLTFGWAQPSHSHLLA